MTNTDAPYQTLAVYTANSFRVTEGVAEGDALTFADDLIMDDTYRLALSTTPAALSLQHAPTDPSFLVAARSDIGTTGNTVHLDCCLTLMADDGTTNEALILVEVEDNAAAAIYLVPLGALIEGANYRLVGIDRHATTTRLADVSSVSFTRGTRITLSSGEQRKIEDLAVGDKILTRDDGAQPIRWIGHSTLRAMGTFAPVTIRKNALHNAADLVLSPDHRLFIYQRTDKLGAGRSEVLVKVRHLINGTTVVQQQGGFVEYFQLLFDAHQIIYAEGIAAESLLLDPRTRATVPGHIPHARHDGRTHGDYEITERLLSKRDAVALLKRASSSG